MIRRLTVLLLAVLTVAAGYLAQGMQPPPAAYDMPRGLGIYFTNADAVVQQMRAALVQHAASIDIAYRGHRDNMANLSAVARELMDAAYAETDVPYEGDYLAYQSGGYEMTYSYTRDGDAYDYTLHIVPQYYTTLSQEEAVTERVQAVMAELHLDRCRTEEETVRTVCDYVTSHVAYDYVHRNNAHYHLKSTAYGALIYGRACCQGYSVLLYRLLREAGISCRIVTGRAELSDGSTEDHAWNTVTLGGQVYNIDATWESGSGTGEFILRTDEDFPRHTRYDEIGKDGLT